LQENGRGMALAIHLGDQIPLFGKEGKGRNANRTEGRRGEHKQKGEWEGLAGEGEVKKE